MPTDSQRAPVIEAAALHRRLLTLDSHIDIPWPTGPDPFAPSNRRVDIVKMQAGQVSAGCFAAYVPQGPCTPEGWDAARTRALDMLDAIAAMGRSEGGFTARVTTTVAQVHAAHADGVTAVIPVVENGHSIGEDLGVLAAFRAKGARYMTLTHNGHNALADSSNPRQDLADPPSRWGGLSPLGRDAIGEMNRLGMLVDVSHTSKASMMQAAALSRTPVVATHSCIHVLCPVPRNLDDEQLDALGATGGLVQITAVSGFVKPRGKPDDVTVSDYMDHLDYAVRRIGVAHVGISSDFDGGGFLRDWQNASQSGALTMELVKRGYSEADIAALWGGNFLRLLGQAEDAAA